MLPFLLQLYAELKFDTVRRYKFGDTSWDIQVRRYEEFGDTRSMEFGDTSFGDTSSSEFGDTSFGDTSFGDTSSDFRDTSSEV